MTRISSSQQLAATFFMKLGKEKTKMSKPLKDYIVTANILAYTKCKATSALCKIEGDTVVTETYVRATSKSKAYEYVVSSRDVDRLICVKKVNKDNKLREITLESLRDFAESYARKDPASVLLVNNAYAGLIHKWVIEAYFYGNSYVDPYADPDFCIYSVKVGEYAVSHFNKLLFKLPDEYIEWSTNQVLTSISWGELLDILNNLILKRDQAVGAGD